jgi:hypothetical protein
LQPAQVLTANEGDKIAGFNVLGQHYDPGVISTDYAEQTQAIGENNGHASAVYHRTATTALVESPTFTSSTSTRMAVSAMVLNSKAPP